MSRGLQLSAVESTIAVHRLEGWQPSRDDVGALDRLHRGDQSFGEYLAALRARYPESPQRRHRPIFRRAVPYFVPGTTVMRNNFGVTSASALAELEFAATAGRMVTLLSAKGERSLDTRVIHQHLFGDVYAWAGKYRTTELRRGERGFAWQSTITRRMAAVQRAAGSIAASCPNADNSRLAYELARLYADYNQIHPFREGNGRTGAVLLHILADACGRRLDLSSVPRRAWYAAAADSMPLRRDGRASHRPFLYLLGHAVVAQTS